MDTYAAPAIRYFVTVPPAGGSISRIRDDYRYRRRRAARLHEIVHHAEQHVHAEEAVEAAPARSSSVVARENSPSATDRF